MVGGRVSRRPFRLVYRIVSLGDAKSLSGTETQGRVVGRDASGPAEAAGPYTRPRPLFGRHSTRVAPTRPEPTPTKRRDRKSPGVGRTRSREPGWTTRLEPPVGPRPNRPTYRPSGPETRL